MLIFVSLLLSIASPAFSRILYDRLPLFGYLFLSSDWQCFDNVPNILLYHLRVFNRWRLFTTIFRIFSVMTKLSLSRYQLFAFIWEFLFCRFRIGWWIVSHFVTHHSISPPPAFISIFKRYLLICVVISFQGCTCRAIVAIFFFILHI